MISDINKLNIISLSDNKLFLNCKEEINSFIPISIKYNIMRVYIKTNEKCYGLDFFKEDIKYCRNKILNNIN